MHPWVAILGLLFLLDGVTSYHRVTGVVGQSVTLPCYYNGEVTSMCWGRGSCPWLNCGTNIIWTDGYRVTYRRDGRYQLNGNIRGRDVSLTINNAAASDSGLYCCRIEVRGWFNDIKTTLELRINPAPPATTTTTTTATTTTTTTTTPTTTTTTPRTTPTTRRTTTTTTPRTSTTRRTTTTTTPRTTPTTRRTTTTTTPRRTNRRKRTTTTTPRTATTTRRTTTTTTPRTTTTTTTIPRTTTTTRKTTITTTPKTTTTITTITTTTPKTTITTTPTTTTTTISTTMVTTAPTTTTTTVPTTINTTTPTMTVTTAPVTARSSTSALPMPAPTKDLQPASLSSPTQTAESQPTTLYETNITSSPWHSCSTDANGTVTQFPDPHWHNNQTVAVLAQETWMSTNKEVYIGISVTILALLVMFVVFLVRRRYFCLGSKAELLRMIPLKDTRIGALKNAALKPIQAEDNVYIIDDNH
uniref:Ig-like domain-containing protein n=1 Tax=Bos indicus x Bos taurus TaxID=30522 RepID=A0A4W2F1L9_BOBOX